MFFLVFILTKIHTLFFFLNFDKKSTVFIALKLTVKIEEVESAMRSFF